MIDIKQIDEIVKRLMDAIPEGIRNAPSDLENHFRSIIQNAFAHLDLVTREEFDAQTQVLARTRAKLDALEQKIKELEDSAKQG